MIEVSSYPLVDLLNSEIAALDDWRSKQKLARRRSRVRRLAKLATSVFVMSWLISLVLVQSDWQLLFIAPAMFSLIWLSIDEALYDIPKLLYDAERAKSAYEISLECTLGGTNANQF